MTMTTPSDEQLSNLANIFDYAALVVEDSLSSNPRRDLSDLWLILIEAQREIGNALDALKPSPTGARPDDSTL